jgi:putative acetyltransferase
MMRPDVPIEIRPAKAEDAAAIRHITYAAFLHHPHHVVGALPTEHLIIDRLRQADALTLALVAEVNGDVCAALAVSPVSVAGKAGPLLGLGPVAVATAYQGRGIGSALIQRCLDEVRRLDCKGIVVLGDPRLYGRFGFRPDAGLTLPGIPPEYFMVLPFADQLLAGEVTYHPAFA